MKKTPLDCTFTESHLVKAGIRFDFNMVDTVCSRKLNGIFFHVILLIVLSFLAFNKELLEQGSILVLGLLSLVGAYVLFYILHLSYYLRLRAKLHQDKVPIVAEAYAVVCLDLKHQFSDYLLAFFLGKYRSRFYKYAVVYKEVGTKQPRFFLTAAVNHKKICFIPEHIGRVFIHRKNSKLYTVDDFSAYQTVSARQKVFATNNLESPDFSHQAED